ncbi:hypothetical protein BD311DRAFT_328304 [Dichomitus squalens]|uniref:Uncharacterized protein n=1 Tax=Dichomitus squalens TaxID=114155 RepID=A0A4Q9MNA5_9APHY|nr:hypothetical protein BD311DRAFT_328304 [Dichomitus squalens]
MHGLVIDHSTGFRHLLTSTCVCRLQLNLAPRCSEIEPFRFSPNPCVRLVSGMSISEIASEMSSVRLALGCLLVETLLCGGFIALYAVIVWQFLSRSSPHARSKRDILLIGASAVMSVLAILHLVIDLDILVQSGLLRGVDVATLAKGITTWNGQTKLGFAKLTIYILQTFIGDSFMIYRAFIIWNNSCYIIAWPVILLTGEVALGFSSLAIGQLSPPARFHAFLQAYLVIAVVTNALATVLVMRPLWSSRGEVSEYRPDGFRLRTVRWRVAKSIVQSAAVFTISAICFTVNSFVSPLGLSASHYIFPPTVAIVFTIAVARICLSTVQESPRPSALEMNYNGPRIQSCPSLPITVDDIEDYSALPIAIHVSVSRTSDHGSMSSCGPHSSASSAKGKDEKYVVEENPGVV